MMRFYANEQVRFYFACGCADVSGAVIPNTAMDKEARKRGTSIYFPWISNPNVTGGISNDICSLVPHQNRNTVVCQMMFDDDGDINKFDFVLATIESKHRLTYSEVESFVTERQPEFAGS